MLYILTELTFEVVFVNNFVWFCGIVFLLVSYQIWRIKRSIFGIFCYFITEKVKNSVQARKMLYYTYEEDILIERQCQNLVCKISFQQFWYWRYSGRPIKVDKDNLKILIEANRWITTWEIARKLNFSNLIIYDRVK